MADAAWNCCRLGARSVYTIQPCISLQYPFIQSYIGTMYACLAKKPATCTFWQNDSNLLGVTAVTRGWNGYRYKSRHRKLTLEKKGFPSLLSGLEPSTFLSRVHCSTAELSPLTSHLVCCRLPAASRSFIFCLFGCHCCLVGLFFWGERGLGERSQIS